MVERLIAAEEKGKEKIRATCKADMEEVNKSDDNLPIVLQKMTFDNSSRYISTEKLISKGGYLSDTRYVVVQGYLTHLYRMIGKTMD